MAPVRCRKLSTTPPLPPPPPDTTSYSIVQRCTSQEVVLTATLRQLSPTRPQLHSRLSSPIRKMTTVGPTALQKQQLIDNLKLELNERVRRLRMQHDIQAQALRHRIEMRINRIPKKMWSIQIKDLLLQHATGIKGAGKIVSQVDARDFVSDVKKLSSRSQEQLTEAFVTNKNSTIVSNTAASTTEISQNDAFALSKPASASNLRSVRSASSLRTENRGISPVKRMESPAKLHPLRNMSPNRSAVQKSEVSESYDRAPHKIQRSNAVKSRSSSKTTPNVITGDDGRIVKTITSSGSLKENKVEGVHKDRHQTITKGTKVASIGSTGGRRVLRTRK